MSLDATPSTNSRRAFPGHPLIVRVTHWVNALAMAIMILSGWEIYNAAPLFAFSFPKALTLGGWLGGALQWHFAAMWLIIFNGLSYVAHGIASRRFARVLLPISPRAVAADFAAALTFRLQHEPDMGYNALQKLFYLGILACGLVVVISGFAIWKPVQLAWLSKLLGGYEASRLVHFLAMAGFVVFLVVHIVMAALVPKSLRSITIGG